jgi:hypothetical protein
VCLIINIIVCLTGFQMADSSGASQGGADSSKSHMCISPLDYVKNKIAEVMRGSSAMGEDQFYPSSSSHTEGSGGDSTQKGVHSSDMARFSSGVQSGSASSSGVPAGESASTTAFREWQSERYKMAGKPPIRDSVVSGSKQRSPRPSEHCLDDGNTGSHVSSGDDILNASSSTGRDSSPRSPGTSSHGVRDYSRDSSDQSPLVTSEGLVRSPRSSTSSGVVHSSESRQQSSQVETSGHISPKAQQSHTKHPGHSPGSDHSASQSGAKSEVSSMSRDSVRPSYLSVDKSNLANRSFDSLESPQAGLVIDESAGADSSGHVDSDSPGEGQGGVSTSSSGGDKGAVDSQTGNRGGNSEVGSSLQRSPHSVHSTAGSPGSAGIHPDSSHYPSSGHSVVTSGGGRSNSGGAHSSTDGVSTSSPSSSIYPSPYLYSALSMHSPAGQGQPAQASSSSGNGGVAAASSTGPGAREPSSSGSSHSAQQPPDSRQSPSFPTQYENLSDDE